jgi:hypothetical protein
MLQCFRQYVQMLDSDNDRVPGRPQGSPPFVLSSPALTMTTKTACKRSGTTFFVRAGVVGSGVETLAVALVGFTFQILILKKSFDSVETLAVALVGFACCAEVKNKYGKGAILRTFGRKRANSNSPNHSS